MSAKLKDERPISYGRNSVVIRSKVTMFSMLAAGLLFGSTYSHAQTDTHAHPSSASQHANGLYIPKSMQVEHEALHLDLAELTKAGGRTGEAAQKVAKVLDHHFQKENEYALPPLAYLSRFPKENSIAA